MVFTFVTFFLHTVLLSHLVAAPPVYIVLWLVELYGDYVLFTCIYILS